MAVDLLGKQGHMLFNNHGWSKMLELAERYGWQPKGTQPPLLEMEEIEVVTNGSSDDGWDGNTSRMTGREYHLKTQRTLLLRWSGR